MLKRAGSWVFSIILIIGAVFLLTWFIYSFDIFPLPEFLDSIFSKKDKISNVFDPNEEKIISSLYGDYDSGKVIIATIDNENMLDFIRNINEPKVYYWEIVSTFSDKDVGKSAKIKVYVSDGKCRIDVADNQTNYSYVSKDNTTEYRNNISGAKRKIIDDTDFALINIASIADAKELIDNEFVNVISSELINIDSEKIAHVILVDSLINKTYDFYISLNTGFVLSAEERINDKIVFTQETTAFDSNISISNDSFVLK